MRWSSAMSQRVQRRSAYRHGLSTGEGTRTLRYCPPIVPRSLGEEPLMRPAPSNSDAAHAGADGSGRPVPYEGSSGDVPDPAAALSAADALVSDGSFDD